MIKRRFFATLVTLSAWATAHADKLDLGEDGFSFHAKRVAVVWNVPTNRLPATMNIYKVIPARFTAEAISNVVAIGHFAEPERVRKALLPAVEGRECLFEEVPAHKTISISPKRGHISFFDTAAMASWRQAVTGLPTEENALNLSLEIGKKLGISSSEFARKPDSHDFLCWRDRRTQGGKIDGKVVKREAARGIFLYREIDGVSFDGIGFCGGLYVNFGSDARIADLDLSWRNLQVKKICPVADRDQITRWIKGGKAVIIDIDEPVIDNLVRLTIVNVVPHYRGASSNKDQDSVFPFAMIYATAEIRDQKRPVTLLCPIIND
jgi:hypothetical protein